MSVAAETTSEYSETQGSRRRVGENRHRRRGNEFAGRAGRLVSAARSRSAVGRPTSPGRSASAVQRFRRIASTAGRSSSRETHEFINVRAISNKVLKALYNTNNLHIQRSSYISIINIKQFDLRPNS